VRQLGVLNLAVLGLFNLCPVCPRWRGLIVKGPGWPFRQASAVAFRWRRIGRFLSLLAIRLGARFSCLTCGGLALLVDQGWFGLGSAATTQQSRGEAHCANSSGRRRRPVALGCGSCAFLRGLSSWASRRFFPARDWF